MTVAWWRRFDGGVENVNIHSGRLVSRARICFVSRQGMDHCTGWALFSFVSCMCDTQLPYVCCFDFERVCVFLWAVVHLCSQLQISRVVLNWPRIVSHQDGLYNYDVSFFTFSL